jgi:Uma2 family endonuclease
MATRPKSNLTVEQYLEAYEGAEGRYELVDGEVLKMALETAMHVRLKGRVFRALAEAIEAKGADCEAFLDGVSIKISARTAREPDVSVQCGAVPDDSMVLSNPLIVVEVVSPSSTRTDENQKLAEYFSVPGIVHYLIVWPKQKYCYHHKRIGDDKVLTTIVRRGAIEFDPPGLSIALNDIFGEVNR